MLGAALASVAVLVHAAAPDLSTTADRTGDVETGRYEEVERLCGGYARAFPRWVRCMTFGRTPEGRPMVALVATRTGALEPAAARARGVPVVLAQGGIHAGEIDGKDAGFRLLGRLLGDTRRNALDAVTWVFVPVFNVDGHERFGPNHRPNQRGPAQMGWRTTAQNLNLNRDYTKVDAPEMAAMLALLRAWDPVLYADLHVTDGADFGLHAGVVVEPFMQGPRELVPHARALRDALVADASARGHHVVGFYPSFRVEDDPRSGFSAGSAPPRFSTTYRALQNRMAVLVETHSWKPYAVRMKVMEGLLATLLDRAAADGKAWLANAAEADASSARLGGADLPVRFDDGPRVETMDFPGCAYTRSPSAISGALRTTYDCTRPETWRVPFHPEPVAVASVTLPRGGWLVPAAHAAWMEEKLRHHGVVFTRMATPGTHRVEEFRVASRTFRPAPYEGRLSVTVGGAWSAAEHAVGAGALWVPVAQRNARLAAHLLEPTAPDSFMAWGVFNAHLEQKEYMEAYVTEQEAERMMAEDPALRVAFLDKLATDKAFAASPQQRLDFFYRRHPSFDARLDLYPVLRMDAAPAGMR